ncbi:drug/metabolite transporter (DMT)-like permease [Sporosarcina luteola]|nr:drug/metabolite transporter (DMT)-like permease [Sporosarcina luteola]
MKQLIIYWAILLLFCTMQWSVGLWIEQVTYRARDAFLVIFFLSFVVYPIYTILSGDRLKRNEWISQSQKRLYYIFAIGGFLSNPALFHLLGHIFNL